jgi:hypothetical protein
LAEQRPDEPEAAGPEPDAPEADGPEPGEPEEASPVFGAAQRIIESAVIAVVTSTGLYLIGSVYTDAYYGRMSIEATTLDLSPPFIALQSAHVLQSLIEYPSAILFFYMLYRLLVSRWPQLRTWYDRAQQRFGRVFLLIVNVLIVAPLLAAALEAGIDEGIAGTTSVLSEVVGLMGTVAALLLFYLIWLSFGPRQTLVSQLRAHKLIPIALVFALYLLDALVSTANGASFDAELLMTGEADSSIEIHFRLKNEARDTLPDSGLILVTARNGSYYVVERQPIPPSGRPVSYAVPFGMVRTVRTQRVNEADPELEDVMIEIMEEIGTPTPP